MKKSTDGIEELSNKELIKLAVKNWDRLPGVAKVLAERFETALKENQMLIKESMKENPDGDDPGKDRKSSSQSGKETC